MQVPWLISRWNPDACRPWIECLRCGWSASIRKPLPRRELVLLLAGFQFAHARCKGPNRGSVPGVKKPRAAKKRARKRAR